MNRPRIGVIGLGSMGRQHLEAIRRGELFSLVGITDHHPGRAAQLAKNLGCRHYTDYHALLPQLDCAVIATDSAAHAAIAADCARARVHVLIEKPLCVELSEGEALIHLAQASGIVSLVGHTELFNPAVVAARELLADRAILRILAQRLQPGPPRETIDIVLNLMIHDLAVMSWLQGADGVPAGAWGDPMRHAVAILRYGEAVGISVASYVAPAHTRTLAVEGDGWHLNLDYRARSLRVTGALPGPRTSEVQAGDSLDRLHQHFLDCVRGITVPMPDATRGLDWVRQALLLRGFIRPEGVRGSS